MKYRFIYLLPVVAALWLPLSAAAQFRLENLPGITGDAPAAPATVDQVKVTGALSAGAKPNSATLHVTADVTPGWHIYSTTQASGGPIKSTIKLAPSSDFKLVGNFTPISPPKVHRYDFWPGLEVEEFSGQVTWTAPIELAAGVDVKTLTISGALNAQVCEDKGSCLMPKDYKFTATLYRSAAGAPVADENALATSAPASDVPAGVAEYRHERSHVKWTGTLTPSTAKPGSIVQLKLRAEPLDDYHLYALAERDPIDVTKPTLIVLTRTSGLAFRKPIASDAPMEKKSDINKSGKMTYYAKDVDFTVELQVPADAKPGELPIAGFVGFQTCTDKVCDQPRAAKFSTTLTVGNENTGSATIFFSDAKYGEAAKIAEEQAKDNNSSATLPAANSANNGPGPAAAAGFDLSEIDKNTRSEHSLLAIIVSAFFGGMILNLMPCVFPVIGLKVLSFVEQSKHDRGRLLALNGWYSLGVVLVFLVIAAAAVVLRVWFNVDFKYGSQNGIAGYAIGMAAVMFVMGLSLLGVWEIPIPGFFGSNKASEAMSREGAFGAISKGAITTILGASCGGPIVFVAFSFALSKSAPIWATFAVFALIGLGMASPYLILAANPRLLKFLPKPGPWMDHFKHLCAFVLLGAMVWILSWIEYPLLVPTIAFLLGLGAACWLIGRVPLTQPLGERLLAWGWGATVAVLMGVFAFSWLAEGSAEKYQNRIAQELDRRGALPAVVADPANGEKNHRLPWQSFSLARLEQLTGEGKTVMVDFTADWCPNCKFLEATVLNTEAIRNAVDTRGIVPLVADYSKTDSPEGEEINKMLTALKAEAIPVLAIFPAGSPNNPIVIEGVYSQQALIEKLEAAGPSRAVAGVKETAMK